MSSAALLAYLRPPPMRPPIIPPDLPKAVVPRKCPPLNAPKLLLKPKPRPVKPLLNPGNPVERNILVSPGPGSPRCAKLKRLNGEGPNDLPNAALALNPGWRVLKSQALGKRLNPPNPAPAKPRSNFFPKNFRFSGAKRLSKKNPSKKPPPTSPSPSPSPPSW